MGCEQSNNLTIKDIQKVSLDNMQATEEVQIDTNLYSRQIGTFGLETMGKLIKMKVLIVGMRGLGVETAKNLILAGPASVTFYDLNPTEMRDLGSNFYLTKEHVAAGTSRAEASLSQLQELNPYVKTNILDKLSIEDLENYSLVCYTENFDGIEHLIAANQFCRSKKVGFLLAETMGCAGYVFSDFGKAHIITDDDGEPCKSFIVVSISQEEEALITVHEDKRHSFQEGDFVKFVEVEGMTELNNAEPYEIT
jgi:ubiquitin-activating enzyme E1